MGQVVARPDRLVAVAHAMEGGHHRRQLGDQADDRLPVALLVGDVPRRVEHTQGSDAGLQRVHGVARLRQTAEESLEFVLDAAVVAELIVEIGEFLLRGQLGP